MSRFSQSGVLSELRQGRCGCAGGEAFAEKVKARVARRSENVKEGMKEEKGVVRWACESLRSGLSIVASGCT